MILEGKIYHTVFQICLKLFLIIVLGFNILLVQSCVTNPVNTNTINTTIIDPRTTLGNSIIWMEQDGLFSTNDATRAQSEIDFPLRLPTFFPAGEKVSLPQIIGPLAQKRISDKIDVTITYILSPSKGAILMEEYNHPILPADPKDDPDFNYIEIEGNKIVTCKGNFLGGDGSVYYFSINGIYFVVTIENLSSENQINIIKSIMNQ